MRVGPTLVLLTRDLRVRDNPALLEACTRGSPVIPAFVLDPVLLARSPNRASFLIGCLRSLDEELRRLGGRLVLRRGNVAEEAARLARETGAVRIHLTADVTRTAASRLDALRRLLPGVEIRTFPGSAVVEAGALRTGDGGPYQRFTPYYRRWQEAELRTLLPPPDRVRVPPELRSEPLPPPPTGISPHLPDPGEDAAHRRLDAFLEHLDRFPVARDHPAQDATSRLSPYLRFGCLSPLEVLMASRHLPGSGPFLRQLAWRDFFRQLTAARPELTTRSLHPRPPRSWRADALEVWCEGRTGVPIVDAAIRQLHAEGWIHPRARLVAAAHLVQTLGAPWQAGARYFDALLVDGDPAVNAGNWQWVAGVGTDTRPGRRISPSRQAQRFDPDGAYVRRYAPELASGLPEGTAARRTPQIARLRRS